MEDLSVDLLLTFSKMKQRAKKKKKSNPTESSSSSLFPSGLPDPGPNMTKDRALIALGMSPGRNGARVRAGDIDPEEVERRARALASEARREGEKASSDGGRRRAEEKERRILLSASHLLTLSTVHRLTGDMSWLPGALEPMEYQEEDRSMEKEEKEEVVVRIARADSKWLTSVRPRARTAAVLARLASSSGKGPRREEEEEEENCIAGRRPSLGMIWEEEEKEEEEGEEKDCLVHDEGYQTPAAAV